MRCMKNNSSSLNHSNLYEPHTWTVIKQFQFHFNKNTDYNIFPADKPGRMNTSFVTWLCTIDPHRHNILHTNNIVTVYCRTVWGELTNDKEQHWGSSRALTQDKRREHSEQAGLQRALHWFRKNLKRTFAEMFQTDVQIFKTKIYQLQPTLPSFLSLLSRLSKAIKFIVKKTLITLIKPYKRVYCVASHCEQSSDLQF